MGILERFFGRRGLKEEGLATSGSKKTACSLQVLFADNLKLDPGQVTRSLRSYHSSMERASCEIDASTASQGTPVGFVGWADHVIRVVGFDNPMPQDVVEKCIAPAHFGQELKARARAHQAHVILYYGGRDSDPLNQYVAQAAVAGALANHGAIVVLNETAHTAFPCEALAAGDGDMIELLRSLPIPILFSGFVKLEVEGVAGVWMRTFGNHVLGLPDFAMLVGGHHEGQTTFDLFCNLMSYLQSSGASFAPGHTSQIDEDIFLKFRSPNDGEPFLENPGLLLVVEKIARSQINRGRVG